MHLENERIM